MNVKVSKVKWSSCGNNEGGDDWKVEVICDWRLDSLPTRIVS